MFTAWLRTPIAELHLPAQRATPSFISGPFLSDWIHFHKRPCVTQTPSIGGRNSLCFVLEGKLMDIESTHKGVNQCFKNATQALQQRPEWPAVTLTRHERFGPRSLSDSCILVESPLSVNSLPRDSFCASHSHLHMHHSASFCLKQRTTGTNIVRKDAARAARATASKTGIAYDNNDLACE